MTAQNVTRLVAPLPDGKERRLLEGPAPSGLGTDVKPRNRWVATRRPLETFTSTPSGEAAFRSGRETLSQRTPVRQSRRRGTLQEEALRRDKPFPKAPAFTLLELLISLSLLSFVFLIVFAATEATGRAWREGQTRTENFQNGRAVLEIFARELAPAVADTQAQFIIGPGEILTKAGASHVAPNSPALLWMAPLGDESELRCVGYYLYRDEARRFYRLKRLAVGALTDAGAAAPFYPGVQATSTATLPFPTSPTTAEWFTRKWKAAAFDEDDPANNEAIVSTVADGVVGFWAQPLDLLGQPIPQAASSKVHPTTKLFFNSAAYFSMATSTPFASGDTFLYQAQTAQTMKANRLPAAVELTVVTLDRAALARATSIPEQTSPARTDGVLDLEAATQKLRDDLHAARIHTAQAFTTRVRLINGN